MSNGISIKSQFKLAGKEICKPELDTHSVESIREIGLDTKTGSKKSDQSKSKSYAQVAGLVGHNSGLPNPGGLKPNRKRPFRLMGRFTGEERDIVQQRADLHNLRINDYVRAAVLGLHYRAPLSKEVRKELAALNRELGRQGTNLNQIARHLNTGIKTPAQANNAVAVLQDDLREVYQALFAVLMNGKEPE